MKKVIFVLFFILYSHSLQANYHISDTTLKRGRQLFMGGDIAYRIPACASCHGPDGARNSEAHIARIAGQPTAYLIQQLKAFRNASRKSTHQGVMNDVALQLSDADIEALANYLTGLHNSGIIK